MADGILRLASNHEESSKTQQHVTDLSRELRNRSTIAVGHCWLQTEQKCTLSSTRSRLLVGIVETVKRNWTPPLCNVRNDLNMAN